MLSLAPALVHCGGAVEGDASDSSEAATTKPSAAAADAGVPKTGPLTATEEEVVLRGILKEAIVKYEEKHGSRLGKGWYGNVTGAGDKCNVVSDNLSPIIDGLVYANIRARNAGFFHHDLATIVAAGLLCEALSGHVYFALYRLDATKKKLGERVVTFDPWRDESAFFEVDPNVRGDTPVPWGLPSYRVISDAEPQGALPR